MTDVADGFAELFQGRLDAYGVAGDSPYADKLEAMPPEMLGVEYQRRIATHLNGTAPMGVYPLRDDLSVRWGCTDLDGGEPDLEVALNIQTMFTAVGVTAWIERSRTKGFHVWVFAEDWVPADVMRRAFLAVHQRLEVPAKEVNPKQTTLAQLERGLGNWVRLCYPGGNAAVVAGRQVVLDPQYDGNALGVDEFVRLALECRTPLGVLEQVADRYVAPPPRQTIHIGEPSGDAERLGFLLTGDAHHAWRYGPREGHDRSNSLARLAHMMAEQNITPADAWVLLRDADARWGKFYDRADGDDQLRRILEVAYE